MISEYHKPVLLKEVIELLDPQNDETIVDATFGFGGHSKALLERIGPKGRLIAIEQDKEILELSRKEFDDSRITFVNDNFSNLASILRKAKVSKIDKILFDLGISSYHFDELDRGFSFKDEQLDMRLNREGGETAADLVNTLPEEDLANMLFQNAGEFLSRRIARIIVEARRLKKIESAQQLNEIIGKQVRKRGKINPATKTFQALRIAVNKELEVIISTLPTAINLLNEGGRVGVISFHSGEDKIVKETFKKYKAENTIEILTKKPLVAEYEEIKLNPRARSAKLRVAKKI